MICPEMFLSGYNIGAEQASRLAEPANGLALTRVAALARASGIALLVGYPERGGDGAIYDAVRLIGRDGRSLANYASAICSETWIVTCSAPGRARLR